MFTIDTPRLIIRDLLESDFEAFYALGSDPAITRFQSFIRMESDIQAREWLKGAAFHNQKTPREAYNLAIVRKADGCWLGWIGMGRPSDRTPGDLDFGYALATKFWGQGYMSEALRGLVDFSFRELEIGSMFGECEQENPGSARVMENAGLRCRLAFTEVEEGTGRTKNMLRYVITRDEWVNNS